MRREMRQLEGAWISTGAIERSKVRLERLGFFEDEPETKPEPKQRRKLFGRTNGTAEPTSLAAAGLED